MDIVWSQERTRNRFASNCREDSPSSAARSTTSRRRRTGTSRPASALNFSRRGTSSRPPCESVASGRPFLLLPAVIQVKFLFSIVRNKKNPSLLRRFGPDGLKLRPAEPYPSVVTKAPSGAASSDDDYEDIFGLDEDDEDDEEDDDYEKVSPDGNNNVANAENNETQDNEDDDEEDDLLGFGALLDIFTGGDDSSSKKKPKGTTTTTTPIPSAFAIPIIHLSTEKPATAASKAPVAASVANDNLATPTENADVQKTQSESVTVNDIESETTFDLFEDTTKNDEEDSTSADFGITEEPAPAPANKVAPTKVTPSPKPAKITKVQAPKKKVTLTSNSPNAITDVKKPAHQDNDDDDQDDEYDYSDGSDEDDEEESNEEAAENDDKHESDKNAEEDDVHEYGDDDDDEEEDAVLSALVEGSEEVGKASGTKKDKMKATTRKPPHRQEIDYDEYLGLLSRNRPARTAQGINRGRQSKVMRL